MKGALKNMNEIKDLIANIDEELLKIEKELYQDPNQKYVLWSKYLILITKIKENLSSLDTKDNENLFNTQK